MENILSKRAPACLQSLLSDAALVYLLIELVDELVDCLLGASWPEIRESLGLDYAQVGMLMSLPQLIGCLVEPAFGILADHGWRRRLIRYGGIGFAVSLFIIAGAEGFTGLLIGLVLFNPSGGAFVSLAQAALVDRNPTRREQVMARWTFFGAAGHIVGPGLLVASLAAGTGWRGSFASTAVLALGLAIAVSRLPICETENTAERVPSLAEVGATLRTLPYRRMLRWILAMEVADLLLDVFTAFLALYLADALGFSTAEAASVLFVRAAAGLLGEAAVVMLLERVSGLAYLRASSSAAFLLYAAFLGASNQIAIYLTVAAISFATAGWYSVLKANLYAELPGRSGAVLTVRGVTGLATSLIPAAVGAIAESAGIEIAMLALAAGPLGVLWVSLRARNGALERMSVDD